MSRAWLVLLALLLCLPFPAAASGSVPAPEQPRSYLDALSTEPSHGLVRSDGGLELLHRMQDRRSKNAGSPPNDAPQARHAHPPREPAANPCAEPAVAVCAPHCERLLYFATAPPARR